MFPMTVTIHNPAQLNAVLNAMRPELQASDFASPAVGAAYAEVTQRIAQREATEAHAAPAPAVTQAQQDAVDDTAGIQEGAKPGKSAKAGPAHGRPTATGAAAAAPEKTAAGSGPAAGSAAAQPQASTAADDTIAYDDVKLAIVALVKAKGAPAAAAVLKEFGAAKGPELKPEQYAAFVAAAKEAT